MRIKIFCGTLLLLILNVITLYAQDPGGPCQFTDVDGYCQTPLDNWVLLLAGVAIIFAIIRLQNKKVAKIGKAT